MYRSSRRLGSSYPLPISPDYLPWQLASPALALHPWSLAPCVAFNLDPPAHRLATLE